MTEADQQDYEMNFNEELPDEHRSGFVAVVGKPNVGKSTLMNALLGEKLAIVSHKPQTTRDKQLGILTRDDFQIVFVDTPGIHIARTSLGEYMVEIATDAIPDADVVLFLVDASELPTKADESIAELVAKVDVPVLLVLNKTDLSEENELQAAVDAYGSLHPDAQLVLISALEGQNVSRLEGLIASLLPEGPRFYPPEQLTETYLRDSAAELIREQVLNLYDQEIPHAVAVQVEEFKERSADMIYIRATIFVEKESQKRIIIGKGGSALKKLGKAARVELQDMLDSKVYLDLWVKVLKNWRKDDQALRRLGFS